jgi:hypothetical protein
MFNTLADAEEGPARKNEVSFVFWNDSKNTTYFSNFCRAPTKTTELCKILYLPSVKKTNMNQ